MSMLSNLLSLVIGGSSRQPALPDTVDVVVVVRFHISNICSMQC